MFAPLRRTEVRAVDLDCLHHLHRCKVRCECEWKAHRRRELRAKKTRPENPDWDPRAFAGNCPHHLTGFCWLEQRDQLGDVVRKPLSCTMTASECAPCDLIRAGRGGEPGLDSTGEECLEGAELVGHDQRRGAW